MRNAYSRTTWLRVTLSIAAVVAIYVAHWFLTYVSVTVLGVGEQSDFECWGHTIRSGPRAGYCIAAWGGWSVAMYLPELALVAAGVAGLLTRSFRVWKWSLGAASLSVVIFLVVVGGTHLWALNQMPVIWPSFP
jgi:hypothetical protein